MAVLLGGEVRLATIEPDNDDGPDRQGATQVLWRRTGIGDKEFAKKAVQVSLAGPVAEMIHSGAPYHPGLIAEWAADWDEAWQAAALLHQDERRLLEYLERTSIQLLRHFQQAEIWAALASLRRTRFARENW
ncbi:MAG TPA: hypothetical protein VMV10_31510 [Pirellulales bacterium]|nr:hypothetical protein [Pirellulales bacterium]